MEIPCGPTAVHKQIRRPEGISFTDQLIVKLFTSSSNGKQLAKLENTVISRKNTPWYDGVFNTQIINDY